MKQIIAFIMTVAFVCLYVTVDAQANLVLGVRGGASLAKLKYTGDMMDPDETISRVLRYQGGVDVGIQFGNLAILSGARFVQRGVKSTDNRDDPNGNNWILPDGSTDVGERKFESKFDFLSFPVLARYRFGQGLFQVGFALGPQFNIGMGKVTDVIEYNLLYNGIIPEENTYDFGNAGDNILKKSNVSFVFMPEVAVQAGRSGTFKVNLVFESSGDMLNKSYLVSNINGLQKVNGSIKSNAIAVEVGYEHKINFNLGVKY